MDFVFNDDYKITDIELRELDGTDTLKVESVEFSSFTKKYVENALKSGCVIHDEQDVVIDEMCLKKDEYSKLKMNIRYSMKGLGIMKEGIYVQLYELVLGNISFKQAYKTYNEEDEVVLEHVEMVMWPYRKYYSKKIDG